jgi:hypothetical protein
MTDTEILIRECLGTLADDAELADLVGAARIRGRRLSRRRHALTGAVAVSALATSGGIAVVLADGHSGAPHGGRQRPSLATAASTSPDPTPMATSTISTSAGNYQALEPSCPSGQLPNMSADHNEPVDPHTVVLAPPGQNVVRSLGSQDFLVDGAPPPAGAHWVLAWNGAGQADISILSLNGGGGSDPFGTSGFTATYTGCEASGS